LLLPVSLAGFSLFVYHGVDCIRIEDRCWGDRARNGRVIWNCCIFSACINWWWNRS